MAVRKLNPVTPGQRHKIVSGFDEITTSKPEKSLLVTIKRSGGRNNTGKMTVRNIGGGHKKKYRIIDFKRDKENQPAEVLSIEYDPNRSTRIALIMYKNGEKNYILAPGKLKVGETVMSGRSIDPKVGNAMYLSEIPLGTFVHNIELKPNQGGKIVRSAGNYAQLTARDGKFAILKLPSGEVRMVLISCKATIGVLSNSDHALTASGKAGRSRWLGRRPRVRGVAMNPVDHPMGGGEGKASGGHPRSRNGIPAKGFRTRDKNKYSNKFIIERRKK